MRNDCIGDGKLLHQFAMRDIHDGTPLETGQEILYLNTSYKGVVQPGDEQIAALTHDFQCTDPEMMQLEPMADRMRFLKNTEKGRSEMSSIIEQYAMQAVDAERAKTEKRDLDRACKLFATGKHDISELAELFSIDPAVLSEACGLQPA